MANQYFIHEANLERLTKKINTIKNKCTKYNLDFHFAIVGEEFRTIKNSEQEDEVVKYYLVEADGSVNHADWEFVGIVDYHEEGNVIRQYKTDIEVPERFRHTDRTCEHCNKIRSRKETYIIHNTSSDDWKQVGTGCLCEFTNGLDAENVAKYISCFDELIKGEAISGSGSYERYQNRDDILRYAYETVKHFGYEKADECTQRPTKTRVSDYMQADSVMKRWLSDEYTKQCKDEMAMVGFNPNTDEVKNFIKDAVDWACSNAEDSNQYLYNLKVICSSEYVKGKDFGILVSLIPTYMRHIEREIAKTEREKNRAAEKASEYIGSEGAKVSANIKSAACVYAKDTVYGTTFMYKFLSLDGNIIMWSTDKVIDTDTVDTITGTVKRYEEYNGVKQTWLTRCKVTNIHVAEPETHPEGKFNLDEVMAVFEG